MVVLSIISLLSSVIYSSLNSSRIKARDAARLASVSELQKAMELYYNKCGTYIVQSGCTGTAYGSRAWGFLNTTTYGSSAGSIAQGLKDAGVMNNLVTRPIGRSIYGCG